MHAQRPALRDARSDFTSEWQQRDGHGVPVLGPKAIRGAGWTIVRAMQRRVQWMAGVVTALGLAWMASGQQREFVLDESGAWSLASEPEAGTDEATIAEARRLLAEDRPREARRILDRWITANEHGSHPLLAQAYLLRGDAYLAEDREYMALLDYERVCIDFPGSEEYVPAMERELAIGLAYLKGKKKRTFGLRITSARLEGEELLVRVQERLPYSELAEQAGYELGNYYFHTAVDLKAASEMYRIFLERYPNSRYRQEVMKQLVYSYVARFKGPGYDPSGLTEARALVEAFRDRYPIEAERADLNTALLVSIDEQQAAHDLKIARWYLRRGDHVSARFRFGRLINEYPGSAAAREAVAELKKRGWPLPTALTGEESGMPGGAESERAEGDGR